MSHSRFRAVLVIASFVLAAAVFLLLPGIAKASPGAPVIPWLERFVAAFFLPAAAALIPLVVGRIAAKEPFRRNYERFRRTYELFLDLTVIVIVVIQVLLHGWLLLFHRLNPAPKLWIVPNALVGLTLLVAGNILPRLRPNSALGIRTPWTLRDERTWTLTHRAGGYLLVLFGLAYLAVVFIDFQKIWWVTIPGLALSLVGLPLLSYLFWRRERPRTRT